MPCEIKLRKVKIMFFKNFKVWETELAGRKLTLETGKMAGLANAAILARYGETEVLCTVTASAKPREGVDFFPLSVDYEEKMYSVGRIPGSFQRREGRASEKAILTSDIGINPQNDGRVIRLSFPPLTEERRKEIVKDVDFKKLIVDTLEDVSQQFGIPYELKEITRINYPNPTGPNCSVNAFILNIGFISVIPFNLPAAIGFCAFFGVVPNLLYNSILLSLFSINLYLQLLFLNFLVL